MMYFENKSIRGIYATRFIVSWLKMGGMLCTGKDEDNFRSWLLSLGLNSHEVWAIMYLATNGKMELEVNAKAFLAKLNFEQK